MYLYACVCVCKYLYIYTYIISLSLTTYLYIISLSHYLSIHHLSLSISLSFSLSLRVYTWRQITVKSARKHYIKNYNEKERDKERQHEVLTWTNFLSMFATVQHFHFFLLFFFTEAARKICIRKKPENTELFFPEAWNIKLRFWAPSWPFFYSFIFFLHFLRFILLSLCIMISISFPPHENSQWW